MDRVERQLICNGAAAGSRGADIGTVRSATPERASPGTRISRQRSSRRGAFDLPPGWPSRPARAAGWCVASRAPRRNGARQLGPAARLEPKGLDYRPPRGENAADGPRSRAPFRPETRSARSHPGIRQMPATDSAVRDRRYSADATPHRPRAESPGAAGEEGARPDLPRCLLPAAPGGGLRGGNGCFRFPTNLNHTPDARAGARGATPRSSAPA